QGTNRHGRRPTFHVVRAEFLDGGDVARQGGVESADQRGGPRRVGCCRRHGPVARILALAAANSSSLSTPDAWSSASPLRAAMGSRWGGAAGEAAGDGGAGGGPASGASRGTWRVAAKVSCICRL